MMQTPFSATCTRKSKLLEIMHSDVCGPMRVKSNGRVKYIVTFIDDHSRCDIQLLKGKDKVFSAFKEYKAFAEKQIGKNIKFLQSDNGREYCKTEFDQFLREHGINRKLTVTYTSEQNSVAEKESHSHRNDKMPVNPIRINHCHFHSGRKQ